jgi:hypothetical protein
MTRQDARFRVVVYLVFDWALRLISGSILVIAAAKGLLSIVDNDCGPLTNLCSAIHSGIAYVVDNCPFLLWLWFHALPEAPPQYWFLALLSPAGFCAFFFFLWTFWLERKRKKLSLAIGQADHENQVERLRERRNAQNVSHLDAGRDISVSQVINESPQIRDWDKKFSNRSIGQIIIAAAGGAISFLFGKWIGN